MCMPHTRGALACPVHYPSKVAHEGMSYLGRSTNSMPYRMQHKSNDSSTTILLVSPTSPPNMAQESSPRTCPCPWLKTLSCSLHEIAPFQTPTLVMQLASSSISPSQQAYPLHGRRRFTHQNLNIVTGSCECLYTVHRCSQQHQKVTTSKPETRRSTQVMHRPDHLSPDSVEPGSRSTSKYFHDPNINDHFMSRCPAITPPKTSESLLDNATVEIPDGTRQFRSQNKTVIPALTTLYTM